MPNKPTLVKFPDGLVMSADDVISRLVEVSRDLADYEDSRQWKGGDPREMQMALMLDAGRLRQWEPDNFGTRAYSRLGDAVGSIPGELATGIEGLSRVVSAPSRGVDALLGAGFEALDGNFGNAAAMAAKAPIATLTPFSDHYAAGGPGGIRDWRADAEGAGVHPLAIAAADMALDPSNYITGAGVARGAGLVRRAARPIRTELIDSAGNVIMRGRNSMPIRRYRASPVSGLLE